MNVSAQTDYIVPYKKRLSTLHKYYEDKFKITKSQWQKFVAGRTDVDTAIIPQDVLNSWRHCREFGLNPLKKPSPPILSTPELQALLDDNKFLINAGMPFINNFKKFSNVHRMLVCLFSRQGYILEIRVDDKYEKLAQSTRLVPGAFWSEDVVGSNSFASVVSLNKPIQYFGPQHYNRAYHGETSSSAPIFNPQGDFIGGIALISNYFGTNPHTLVLAVSMAQAIENSMKA